METGFFDTWAATVRQQMEGKGHGFSLNDRWHVAALLTLVASEVHEAIHVVKKEWPFHIENVGEELADVLIRQGHIAATAGISLDEHLPYSSFGEAGRYKQPFFSAFAFGQWATIAKLGMLAGRAHDVEELWSNESSVFVISRSFCTLFALVCGAAVTMGIDIDQEVDAKMIKNSLRPYRFGVSQHG